MKTVSPYHTNIRADSRGPAQCRPILSTLQAADQLEGNP